MSAGSLFVAPVDSRKQQAVAISQMRVKVFRAMFALFCIQVAAFFLLKPPFEFLFLPAATAFGGFCALRILASRMPFQGRHGAHLAGSEAGACATHHAVGAGCRGGGCSGGGCASGGGCGGRSWGGGGDHGGWGGGGDGGGGDGGGGDGGGGGCGGGGD